MVVFAACRLLACRECTSGQYHDQTPGLDSFTGTEDVHSKMDIWGQVAISNEK